MRDPCRVLYAILALTLAAACFACGPAAVRPDTAGRGAADAPGEPGVAPAEARFHFIDVGQGAAVLVHAPGAAILVDGGPDNGAVMEYLRALGVDRLDLVVASHAHADHVDGLIPVLEQLEVGEVWYNGQAHTTRTFERFVDAVLESGARYHEPARGERRELGGLELTALHPAGSLADSGGDLNAGSIVVRVCVEEIAVLLTGDATAASEAEMLGAGAEVGAQVLQLGHHGSRTSTTAEFVASVRPEVAVYQAAEGNPYGHPHPEPLERLAAAGVWVYGTDRSGTVIIRTDGTAYTVEAERPGRARAPPGCEASPSPVEGPGARLSRVHPCAQSE